MKTIVLYVTETVRYEKVCEVEDDWTDQGAEELWCETMDLERDFVAVTERSVEVAEIGRGQGATR